MKHSQRAAYQRYLLTMREQLAPQLGSAGHSPEEANNDLPRLGDESLAGTYGASDEDDRAISAHAVRELESIDSALQLLHDTPADYGVCVMCNQPIPLERLRLVPGTRYCERHVRDP
jgi:RNA polymerase-binding transcription factor DksA